MRIRLAIPGALLVAGVVGAALVLVADDVTWKAVWIGVTSTVLTAGLVDGSALLEARRREQAVLRVAGDRVGRVHQQLLQIIVACFDVSLANAASVSRELRDLNQSSIDLTATVPHITPPRTKQTWVAQCVGEIDEALDVALSLGAQTTEAPRFELLDASLRSNPFIGVVRMAPLTSSVSGAELLAHEAANILDVVQKQVRFFARRGGPHWRFGQL